MNPNKYFGSLFVAIVITTFNLFAQDKEAKITLSFDIEDSAYICKALVSEGDTPVKEINVKFYVQRLFSLLPIDDGDTDDDGMVQVELPKDIPGDEKGNLEIVAKIEDDENYTNTKAKGQVKWGKIKAEPQKLERSLSASRGNAPIYFVVIANLIIIGIWGTLVYVVMQVFKIKKIGKQSSKK